MKVNELISEVLDGFEREFFPSDEFVLAEYNRIVRFLWLLLPESDGSITLPVYDGKLESSLLAIQIRRVFEGEYELLRASRELITLMPEAKLFCPSDDCIYVTANGDCTVYYRSLPSELTMIQAQSTDVPFDMRYIPLLRTWLIRSVYIYLGDFESADAYGTEYNKLLEEFKRENGVSI